VSQQRVLATRFDQLNNQLVDLEAKLKVHCI